VLNFGIPGNATPENTAVLEQSVVKTHPDFVLLAWYVNDVEATAPPDRPPHFIPLLPWPEIEADLYGRSALFSILKIRWANLQQVFKGTNDYPDYMRKRFGDPDGADAREADAQLRTFIAACRSHGFAVGIVLWPHLFYDLGSSYPFAYLHDRVLAICADERIPCVDLRPSLATQKNPINLWVSPFDTHPGLKANEIAAVRLLGALGPTWMRGVPGR
jgi:hypothetical protein